jgi:hypothetical protein
MDYCKKFDTTFLIEADCTIKPSFLFELDMFTRYSGGFLIAGTTYKFTLKSIKVENSLEYRSLESNNMSATTTAPTGGGTGGGGTGGGGTAADELRRQQEAAAAAKRKQDQELREILSLVPSIAGLAQGVAGLGNSLLFPKKCVKGKLVKKVKASAKCPKGYKARR